MGGTAATDRFALVMRWFACALVVGSAAAGTYQDWVINPDQPGPNIPPTGRSLFDYLVRDAVPFPFTALTARVNTQLAVLIPLGRSLQRNAAKPDFFRFPRAVIAADSNSAMPIKDRLFMGYQEKAGILEVISYNEAAGRFEFQLVRDYRQGGRPEVLYANRAICTQCHQNQAPIFPRQLWDETNANPGIAALLRKEQINFYNIPIDRGVDIPYNIDNAAGRANYFSATQLLWREGCGDSNSCRASALTAALQFRLSGLRYFDVSTVGYHEGTRRLASRWPHGLSIPNPDIPNRNPLVTATQLTGKSLALELIRQQSSIDSRFEPLVRRPALETWTPEELMARLVSGLAEFITEEDARDLDKALYDGESQRITSYKTACKSKRTDAGRMDFQCTGGTVGANGMLYVNGSHVGKAVLTELSIANETIKDLDATVSRNMRLIPRQRESGLYARTAEGNAIRSIELKWTGNSGTATIDVADDFVRVARAIGELAGTDALSTRPFRRAVVVKSIYERLGMQRRQWCCLSDLHLSPPRVAVR